MNQYLIKMKYVAHFNYVSPPGETFTDIDPVQPGQAYSVKEALARIQKGLPVSGRSYAYQDEGETEPPLRMNDLTDLDYAKNQLKAIKKEQSDAVKKIKEAAAKKAAEEYSRDNVSGV